MKKIIQLGCLGLLGMAGWGCSTSQPEPREVRRADLPVATAPASLPSLWPADAPSIHARSAILIDARSGRVIYQKNADAQVPVASTQKLLTALVVLNSGDLSDLVRVAREDTRVEPMKLGLRTGDIYSRRDLMAALIVKSENDAAAALARDVAGGEAAFAQKMNAMAWDLGARNSHFVNSHGLPAPQYSTARDMARVAWKAYREPEIRRLAAKKYHAFVFNNGRTKMLENTNKLLGEFYPVNGMKTGFTNAAGRCLIASASANGREVIFVQLGSRTNYIFDDAERMLRWALAVY